MSLLPEIDELLELRHRAHAIGLGAHHRVASALSGLYASVFRGQGMDFEEAREYREGDEIRNMDWRVTARTGVPHLKVFREERERAVLLCVDVGPHMAFGTRGTFKSVQAARVAALLGWSASINRDRVGALLYGDPDRGMQFLPPSRSRRSFWRMLQALSEARENRGSSADEALYGALDKVTRGAPTGGLVFLVGDYNRDPAPIQTLLGRLVQRHEVVVIPIDDPADHEIPDIGRVVFTAPGGQRVEVDTGSEEGRFHYRRAWEGHRRALEELCANLGVPVIPVTTRDDAEEVLIQGLRRRRRHLVRR